MQKIINNFLAFLILRIFVKFENFEEKIIFWIWKDFLKDVFSTWMRMLITAQRW